MVHYAVTVDGKVIGSRSSARHLEQIYQFAVIEAALAEQPAGVVSYHSSEALALKARDGWRAARAQHPAHWATRGPLSVVPVAVTAKRAKVGDVVVCQGVL